MTDTTLVTLIDDNAEDLELYGRLLEQQGSFKISGINPRDRNSIESYTNLASIGEVDAVVIDQRLDELTGVGYDGIGVADYLRSLRPELPIYILTQYSDDLGSRAMAVESIISKKEFNNSPDVFAHRILRAARRYKDALSEKHQRFLELIDMKTKGDINPDFAKELDQLRAEIERVETIVLDKKLSQPREERSKERKLLEEVLGRLREIGSDLPPKDQR